MASQQATPLVVVVAAAAEPEMQCFLSCRRGSGSSNDFVVHPRRHNDLRLMNSVM